MTAKAPNSRRNLDIAIERYAEGRGDAVQMRRTLANAVVGQMLPSGVVKGGSPLKLRFGEGGARASRDLDTARAEDLESFIENFERNLEMGWNGFTGTIAPGRPAKPKGVPKEYVMKPYSVRLSYNGNHGSRCLLRSGITKSAMPTRLTTRWPAISRICSPRSDSPNQVPLH